MAELKESLKKSLGELRKEKERKFDQTVDLIINLQKIDLKKTNLNTFVTVPHKVKDKKIAGFLEATSPVVDTILGSEFGRYKDKKLVKKLVSKYDFFIAQGSLMPKVATTFGRVLGPAGKMPSPQMGIILNAEDKTITDLKDKINKGIRVRLKEASVKVAIGKQSMKDDELVGNAMAVYGAVLKELPRNKENIKNIEIKFTMTKPQKIHEF